MGSHQNVTDVLVDTLKNAGVDHLFGIPGDYALGLFDAFTKSDIELINTCDEQGAGFAADAYARVKGLGVVCVTYGVGGLKLVNSTAQAYAERSPVIVISGAPGLTEQHGNALLHHRVRNFDTQMKIFREITVAQTLIDDPARAAAEFQRVVSAAIETKRPVYIEIPRDIAHEIVPSTAVEIRPAQRPEIGETLQEAVAEVIELIDAAERPVILAGVEIHRFNLQQAFVSLVERTGIPFATTILGKSVISETHPGFVGVYSGGLSRVEVREVVEQSDCVILLGAMLTDLNTGIFSAKLETGKIISATAELLSVHRHTYPGVTLSAFMSTLLDADIKERDLYPKSNGATVADFEGSDSLINIGRLFECLNSEIDDSITIIADPGDALFGATDLTIHAGTEFVACAYYASLGFAVPGAIGLQLAAPERRPIVLVGDGAFQMTGMELATIVRYGLSPIVIVIDNNGYGTERPMLDGPFNDVQAWNIAQLPSVINGGESFSVKTELEFQDALQTAKSMPDKLAILHVQIAQDDLSPALTRLTANLKSRV